MKMVVGLRARRARFCATEKKLMQIPAAAEGHSRAVPTKVLTLKSERRASRKIKSRRFAESAILRYQGKAIARGKNAREEHATVTNTSQKSETGQQRERLKITLRQAGSIRSRSAKYRRLS